MTDTIRIAGICGSLREQSFNLKALRAAALLAPEGVELDIIRLHGIPLFDQDIEKQGWPEPVERLRERVFAAHGVIFASPEYNYSFSGVIKNAIDWLSRPEGAAPLNGKPAAIIGAAWGRVGTARMQAHMRDVVFYNAMPLLPTVEILISQAGEKFDAEGRLTDEKTRDKLTELMRKLRDFIVTLRG